MNSTIPSLPKGNFGRHLELPEKRQILQKEFNSALEAARILFFRILLSATRTVQSFDSQSGRSMLFRLENFQSKIQYLDSVPSEVLKKGNLVQINDYLSTTSVLVHDEERKRELRGRVGGGLRLKLRTMRAREVPGTYLAAFAREKIQETPLLAPVLFDKSDELFDFIQKRLQKLESLAANGFAAEFSQKLVEFSKENAEFVADRAKMRTPAEIQREINKLVPAKRSLAGEIVVLSSLSAMDCLNELVEYPSWAGYHYYFVRVCSESPLTMEYNNGMVIVKENGKRRLARLRFSRYTFKVQPSRIIKENSVVDGQTVKLEYLSPLKTAPSISTPHEDYEHRLAETSIPNEHQARILGEKEMLLRFNNEISVRLNALHTDMESLRDTLFLNTRLDPAVTFACENERRPTPLESPG
uniref:Uncharacterized protein n=1 Tax=Panagrolaimus sp. JU765 TaxID=591449 RepID=A0AC34R7C8_9BILA